jgi:hypothetical protein
MNDRNKSQISCYMELQVPHYCCAKVQKEFFYKLKQKI